MMKMTIMMSDNCACREPSARDVGRFLAQYASWMTGCGATCIRIEKNVNRIAATYGKRVELTIMPRHVQMSVSDHGDEAECLTLNTSVKATPISLSLIHIFGIADASVGLGYIDIPGELDEVLMRDLEAALEREGFEILKSREAELVELAKGLLIKLARAEEETPRKLSVYLSEALGVDLSLIHI